MKSKIFFPMTGIDDLPKGCDGGRTEMDTFLNTPTVEIRDNVQIYERVGEVEYSGVIIFYRENNGAEREQELIDEHGDLERVKKLAQQIAEDNRPHACLAALQALKNNEQRRVFLLELHNITSGDAETVMALVNLGIVRQQ